MSQLKVLNRLPGPSQLAVIEGGFGVIGSLVKIAEQVVTGYNERRYVRELVEAVRVDQEVRHADVQCLEAILDKYLDSMSPEMRDEYHRAILRLLSTHTPMTSALLRTR